MLEEEESPDSDKARGGREALYQVGLGVPGPVSL